MMSLILRIAASLCVSAIFLAGWLFVAHPSLSYLVLTWATVGLGIITAGLRHPCTKEPHEDDPEVQELV